MEERELELFIMNDPKSVISEAFRVLRTNLQFSSIDKPVKKVVVTSSMPQEGKSTVAANLAVSIASTRSKVLLVDADLRRPKLYKLFRLENYKGLSNFLAEDLPLESVITKMANLHIITSGPIPPNPAEILGSSKMKKFLDEMATKYDMILLDAPPVNSVADAAILSTLVDGVILVVETGVTAREAAIAAKQQLEKVNAKILGVVLNKIKQDKNGGYYYYYYYYGEEGTKKRKKKR
ncbi:Tyrosine-protein kinase YwqD [Fervidicola ferrireducens]|uniref:non-specific protein-tyrosine kinase n=1 Tax=Fervidicola ferrireducens TaxID=520764 RepID=A0A140LCR7_9FIRM|nr:CpsD/CapB family tyrosine-protein kinase [Fervidicola ferrireducens]KXG78342.1 Tyrosine-protein kinase YwqD [Fervidicola ferrireducens]